jgi:hypothetical protein
MRSGKLVTQLDRYIFRQLAFALIAVTGGLTALVWLIQSLRFVELVVNHGLSIVVFADSELHCSDPADYDLRRRSVHLSAPCR